MFSFILMGIAQATGSEAGSDAYYDEFDYPYELTLWDYLWMWTAGLSWWIYLPFFLWMMFYCVRRDPEKYIWFWIILIFQPLGAVLYFFIRYLPSSQWQWPAFTHRWTKASEIKRLETAARQIGNAHQFVLWADALRQVGSKEDALSAYRKALAKEPDNLAALWGASLLEYQLEEYGTAKEHLEKILEKDPAYKFGDVSLHYGKTLVALNETDAAYKHMLKHTKKWRQPEAMYVLANLHEARKEIAAARNALQNLIIDIDSSPRAIARKQLFWKTRAKRMLKRLPKTD